MRLAVVSVPHPLLLRGAVLSDPLGHGPGSGYALGFQLSVLPERQLVRHDGERVGRMLRSWSGPGWPDPQTERRCRVAMCLPSVPGHAAFAIRLDLPEVEVFYICNHRGRRLAPVRARRRQSVQGADQMQPQSPEVARMGRSTVHGISGKVSL